MPEKGLSDEFHVIYICISFFMAILLMLSYKNLKYVKYTLYSIQIRFWISLVAHN